MRRMYSICGIHSCVCSLFPSTMDASAITRALSVTWTAKVTKVAVRLLGSREVLEVLPCRLRRRRGRPILWRQNLGVICVPNKGKEAGIQCSTATMMTTSPLTTTTTITTVRKLVRLFQEKPNVCGARNRRRTRRRKGWGRSCHAPFLGGSEPE